MLLLPLAFSVFSAVAHASALYKPLMRARDVTPRVDQQLSRRQSIPIPANLTTEQLEAVYNATCSAASSPPGIANLTADINNLTMNSIAIQNAFESVGAQLSFIDGERLDGDTFFSPRWENITQQWTNILWASRDTATDTATTLGSFIDIIMPVVVAEANVTEAVETLQGFQNVIHNLSINAQTTESNFVALQANLASFSSDFSDFASEEQVALNQTIVDINAHIAQLQGSINNLISDLVAVGTALGITFAAVSAGSDVVDAVAFPLFSTGIIIAGAIVEGIEIAALLTLGVLLATDIAKQSTLQGQVQVLEKQEAGIEEAQSTLTVLQNTTVPTMINQLGAFTNIWAIVNSDINQSIAFINSSISEASAPLPLIFWATANEVPCIYEAMIPALQDYADGIENSGIPPPTDVAGFTPLTKVNVEQHNAQVQAIVARR